MAIHSIPVPLCATVVIICFMYYLVYYYLSSLSHGLTTHTKHLCYSSVHHYIYYCLSQLPIDYLHAPVVYIILPKTRKISGVG